MGRKIYLDDIPLDEAWRRFVAALDRAGRWRPMDGEEVSLSEALGRITAAPVWATVSSPAYHASAMDGYAVRAVDTTAATETSPTRLSLGSQAHYVDTGDPIPEWADAVVMIEHVQPIDDDAIEIRGAVAPWTSVRPIGEDMVATELLLPANHVLRPVDLGAVAGGGHATVDVRRRPRVAVIPTGTELITVERAARHGVGSGDIIEFNSIVLAAQVAEWGALATRYDIVPDDHGEIRSAVREAARTHDLVLINAGSSAGSEDFTADVIRELGSVLVHGVAVRPGHPVVLGMIDREDAKVPVVGIPGYPVSAVLTAEIFVEPLLSRWSGTASHHKPVVEATITRKLLSPMGEDEYVRVTTGRVNGRVVAAPLSRGAGLITTLVRADGLVRIPRFSEGVAAGEKVSVELYVHPDEIDRTIVHIGSHDLILDLLAQELAAMNGGPDPAAPDPRFRRRLVSAHAGSVGGLVALRRGEAHLAGSHLLDPATGEYNLTYLRRYLPGIPVVPVTLVRREQGLMVPKGNPKGVTSLADLARPDLGIVNRQRGAGTRILLDYQLERLGIAPESVSGYRREEYTHLAVAAAVQSGRADCGLGIRAAARALDLDFVPVHWERYDLVIPEELYRSELLRPLFELLRSDGFREKVRGLEGYDPEPMGQVASEEFADLPRSGKS